MAPSAVHGEVASASPPIAVSAVKPSQLPPGLKPIPPERVDLRSDTEIAIALQTRQSITSQKNVWAFWHQGWSAMRPWTQRNVIAWVRKLGPGWTVHVLDSVPGSETNVSRYVEDEAWFPTAFLDGAMDGPHVGAHQGDLIRLPLLWLYGGVWMDVGLMLFMHLDDFCWDRIEDPMTPYELAGLIMEFRGPEDPQTMLNGFIASKSGNPFIKRWHDIYLTIWNANPGATNATDFHKHPLLRHLPHFNPPLAKLNFPEEKNVPPEVSADYLAHFLCFERLRGLVDPEDGFDGDAYCSEKMLLFDAMKDM